MAEALPPKRILRRMGYLRDQEGIMRRFLREGEGWMGHLERCKAFIRSAFQAGDQGPKPPGTLAVLGSGWLLDLPLEALRERFSRLYLVDLYHPPQVRKRVERLPGVSLLETDLSGGALAQAWAWSRHRPGKRPPFEEILRLAHPLAEVPAEAYLSLNLLNQLDILLCDFLARKGMDDAAELAGIRRRVQAHHLEWITQRPACLISDVLERNQGPQGAIREKDLIYVPLPEASREEAWEWAFDHSGHYQPGQHTTMTVRALEWD